MLSFCVEGFSNNILVNYFSDNIEYILYFVDSPYSTYQTISLALISSIISCFPIVFSDYRVLNLLFDTINKVLNQECSSYIQYLVCQIIESMSSAFPDSVLESNIQFFIEIIEKMLNNEQMRESEFIGNPYRSIGKIVSRLPETSMSIIYNILEQSLESFKNSLSLLSENQPVYLQIQQSSLVSTITFCYLRLIPNANQQSIEELMHRTIETYLTIIEHNIFIIFEEVFASLSCIIRESPPLSEERRIRLFYCLDIALNTGNPSIIGRASSVVGSYFFAAKESGISYIQEPLMRLLLLFSSNEVDFIQPFYLSVVNALSDMFYVYGTNVDSATFELYIDQLFILCQYQQAKETETEEIIQLYYSVLISFLTLVKVFSEYDEILMSFVPRVLKFIDRVWKLKAFTDESIALVLSLVMKISNSAVSHKLNIAIHRTSIKELIALGKKCKNDNVSHLARETEGKINKI